MTENLISHITRYADLSKADIEILNSTLTIKRIDKNEILQNPTKIAREKYFVSKGCLRSYFVNNKGVEQILQFAIENWWIGDYESLENNTESTMFIDAVEDSEVVVLRRSDEENLFRQIPNLERYFRIIVQRERTAHLTKLRYTLEFTREEAYLHFVKHFPQFVERVPDYMIASFLNLTPEYLSKVRRKIVS